MVQYTPDEYEKIHKWMKLNRKMLQNIYTLFLSICNDTYQLELHDSKQLYHDLSIYFYHTLRDDYGNVLNTVEEQSTYDPLFYRSGVKQDLIYGEEYIEEEEEEYVEEEEEESEEEEDNNCSVSGGFPLWRESILSKYNMEEIRQKFFENHKEDSSFYHFSPKSD